MLILNEGINEVPDDQTQPPQEATWQYSPEDTTGTVSASIEPVSWTASEYIEHAKGLSWFVLLGLGLVALVALVYFMTGKDIFASVMVGIAGLVFGIFAARPPKVLQYSISPAGVQIGEKLYPFKEFKSFAVLTEGPLPSLLLMPLKRFLPPITLFYDPKSEDAILNALSAYLPHEEKEPDAVDRLMSRIRF